MGYVRVDAVARGTVWKSCGGRAGKRTVACGGAAERGEECGGGGEEK